MSRVGGKRIKFYVTRGGFDFCIALNGFVLNSFILVGTGVLDCPFCHKPKRICFEFLYTCRDIASRTLRTKLENKV